MAYFVRWEMNVEAASPEEAARKARAAQVREGTIATVFKVYGPNDDESDLDGGETVDLTELDETDD